MQFCYFYIYLYYILLSYIFREFGSNIEKALYKDMTVPELIERILKKRAVSFMNPNDEYLLLSGEQE